MKYQKCTIKSKNKLVAIASIYIKQLNIGFLKASKRNILAVKVTVRHSIYDLEQTNGYYGRVLNIIKDTNRHSLVQNQNPKYISYSNNRKNI